MKVLLQGFCFEGVFLEDDNKQIRISVLCQINANCFQWQKKLIYTNQKFGLASS